jgi:hypothetical protein
MPVHVSGYSFTTSSSSFKNGRKGKTNRNANLEVFNDNKKHNYVFHQRDNNLINKLQNQILSPGPIGLASTDQIEDIITKTRRRRRQQKQRRQLTSSSSSSTKKKPFDRKKKRKNKKNNRK